MAQLFLVPNGAQLDEDGNVFPSTGLSVTMTPYYEEGCRQGDFTRVDRSVRQGVAQPAVYAPVAVGLVTTQLATSAIQREGQYVTTIGYATAGDGGGAMFRGSIGASAGSNGYTKINCSNGQWAAVMEGGFVVRPQMFGSYPDTGDADQSVGYQLAINAIDANGGGTLLHTGLFTVKDINQCSDLTLAVSGVGCGVKGAHGYSWILGSNVLNGGTSDPDDNIKNITWRGLRIEGRVATEGFSEQVYNAFISATTNFTAEDCDFVGFRGDGIALCSGNTNTEERHNINARFLNCRWDGVNNDNRNGLTVIDCDGVYVDPLCSFKNCTRFNMPGAIDIEPDQAYNVVRNILIDGPTFENIGGNVAIVAFALQYTQAQFATPAGKFTVRGCLVGSGNTSPNFVYVGQNGVDASASTLPLGVSVTDNRAEGYAGNPYNITGVRDFYADNNQWTDVSGMPAIGLIAQCYDVRLGAGERFLRCGVAGGPASGLLIAKVAKMQCAATFDNCGLPTGAFGGAIDFGHQIDPLTGLSTGAGASSEVDLSGLRVLGTRTTTAVIKEAGHVYTGGGALNRKRGWDISNKGEAFTALAPGEELQASWPTLDVPNILNGASYTSAGATATGAALGDRCGCSCSIDLAGLLMYAYVSAANTVKFVLLNATGVAVDLGSADYKAWVIK